MQSEDVADSNIAVPMAGAAVALATSAVDSLCRWLSSVLPTKSAKQMGTLSRAFVDDDLGSIEALSQLLASFGFCSVNIVGSCLASFLLALPYCLGVALEMRTTRCLLGSFHRSANLKAPIPNAKAPIPNTKTTSSRYPIPNTQTQYPIPCT